LPLEVVDFSSVKIVGNERIVDDRGRPGVRLTGDDAVTLQTGNFTRYQPFSVTLSLHTPDIKSRAVVFHRSRAWTDAGSRGYQLLIEDGKLSASLIHFWPGNAMRVVTRQRIPVGQWLDVAMVYDGSMRAAGLQLFVNGQRQSVEIVRDHLTRNITGGGGDQLAIGERFRDRGFTGGMVSAFQVFDRQISELEVAALHDPQVVAALVAAAASGQVTAEQEQLIRQHYRLNHSWAAECHRRAVQVARDAFCQLQDRLPEIMVMRELPQPRSAWVLARGLYDQPGEAVTAETPQVLPPMDPFLPRNRLGLARWLTDPGHPLTARVAVNHFWQLIFGDGLVRTPEDFGRQGAPPIHPELLDWLANDFVEHGWNVKRLLKQLVMSRAYRQSSRPRPELQQLDPENRWLARAPSWRLPAEMLRDNVLAVSGLLVDRQGGPPAKPYELAVSFKPSRPDAGDGLYRRSLYTYWKRTGPAPVMMALDAAKRDVCRVRRERTSSPLQALAMLNGVQFVEACRALSERLIDQHGSAAEQAILVDMFRLLTSRRPTNAEAEIIADLFRQQQAYFREHPQDATKYLSLGHTGQTKEVTPDQPAADATPPDAGIDPAVLAAWSVVANTLINHDECVSKR
jgi:hypothetical protein